MSLMCAICRENLEQPSSVDSESGSQDPRISTVCTTRCGHVFHFPCLNRWWVMVGNVTAEAHRQDGNRDINNGPAAAAAAVATEAPRPRFTCPLCGSSMPTTSIGTHVFELFISYSDVSGPDDSNYDELRKKLEELQVDNAKLAAQIAEVTTKLAGSSPAH